MRKALQQAFKDYESNNIVENSAKLEIVEETSKVPVPEK